MVAGRAGFGVVDFPTSGVEFPGTCPRCLAVQRLLADRVDCLVSAVSGKARDGAGERSVGLELEAIRTIDVSLQQQHDYSLPLLPVELDLYLDNTNDWDSL